MILFYAAQNNRVVETLEQQLGHYKVARCRCLETMEGRLRKPRHGLEIALLVVEDRKEIARFQEIQGLVRDLRLVLVLPDRDSELVSQAHKLAPRFIAYADHSIEQIGAVIQKMTGASQHQATPSRVAIAEH